MSTELPEPRSTEQPPTCAWHPDRETYIQCTRCGRPICPDCMNNAPVGFQCPDCVADGQAKVREKRTALGARIPRSASVSMALIVINVLCFAVESFVGQQQTLIQLGLVGDALSDGEFIGVANGEYYRLLTSAFLHIGPVHLLLNMLCLYYFGPHLEALLGHARFLTLYLLSAIGGSVVSYVVSEPNVISAGASGAIFGLFGAVFVLHRRLKQDTRGVLVLIGINVVFGFVLPNVNYIAHFGGLVTGAIVAAVFAYLPWQRRVPGAAVQPGAAAGDRTSRALIQAAALLPLVIVLVAAVAWRTYDLTHPF